MSIDDVETFLRCVRMGITGYVAMDASASEVAAAVRSVAYEGAFCPPSRCTHLLDYVARKCAASECGERLPVELTRREQQLPQMIESGQPVKNHVHRILRKLGSTDRMEAARVCRQQGLVSSGQ